MGHPRAFTSHSEAETERIAVEFAKTLHGGETLLLSGPLGAGKTVFVRGLAAGLGVRDRITSPTFVLMRIYRVVRRESRVVSIENADRHLTPHDSRLTPIRSLVHVDAYRVREAGELETIGLPEWVGRPDAVVVIEWGERVRSLFRKVPHHAITIGVGDGTARTVTIIPPRRTLPPRS